MLRKLLFTFGVLSTVALGGGCFATDPAGAAQSGLLGSLDSGKCTTPDEDERMADQVLQLVNLERVSAGLPPVIHNPVLSGIASDYACRMVEKGFFDHTDPVNGFGPADRAFVGSYNFYAIGENLAAGQRTAAEVMQVWMDSPAHRDIILDPKWTEIGIGVRTGGQYAVYWVQEFGTPAEE